MKKKLIGLILGFICISCFANTNKILVSMENSFINIKTHTELLPKGLHNTVFKIYYYPNSKEYSLSYTINGWLDYDLFISEKDIQKYKEILQTYIDKAQKSIKANQKLQEMIENSIFVCTHAKWAYEGEEHESKNTVKFGFAIIGLDGEKNDGSSEKGFVNALFLIVANPIQDSNALEEKPEMLFISTDNAKSILGKLSVESIEKIKEKQTKNEEFDFDDEIPHQKVKDPIREECSKKVSFMSFNADSSEESITGYFNKANLTYKVANQWKSSGSLDAYIYRLEDFTYKNAEFNYIDIELEKGDGFLQTYDELRTISCYLLTDNDFDIFFKYLQSEYKFSQKEDLFYGASRFESNKERYKRNKKYEGPNSGVIFYDEISYDKNKKEFIFTFTVEHKIPVIVSDEMRSKYVPFEKESEINRCSMVTNHKAEQYMVEYTHVERGQLFISFKNCSTFSTKKLTPEEAYEEMIIDQHPFGKLKN